MTYSWKAAELRRCRATTKGGEPCRAWAIWGHSDQLCAAHAGVTGGPWRPRHERNYGQVQHARYSACTCPAYNWPHRPGGGLCQWPDAPEYRLTTPAGTPASRA